MIDVALQGLGLTLGLMAGLWLISIPIRNVSIVDAFWGAGFVVLAWLYASALAPVSPRGWLLVGLTTVWGGRLSIHLLGRWRGKPEDFRYAAFRDKAG